MRESYGAILAYTDGDEASDARIRLAAELARQFEATLIGLGACALRPPIVTTDPTPREIEAEIAAAAKHLADTERKFLQAASGADRKAEWRASHKLPNEAVAEAARAADLIIIGRDLDPSDPLHVLDPGVVLLRAGRPVLVVPKTVHSLSVKRVLIAWQDSREARRSLRDSLPLLTQAEEVLLTEVCEPGEAPRATESVRDVARYLFRHHIKASAGITLRSSGSVADDLIGLAGREKVDLVVAGAYGHSRLGEWVFGGVTRDLLNRSPVCCLFSH